MADGKDRDWLGMNAPIERRDMLNGLLVGTGLALAGCAPSGSEGARIAAAEPQNQQGYYPPQRQGMRGNQDRQSTCLNSSHSCATRMPSSACTKKKDHKYYVK